MGRHNGAVHGEGIRTGLSFGVTSGVITTLGLMVGVFFVTTAFVITYIFERRPLGLWLINGGYHMVSFTLMGLILGAWPA